jgi:amidase
MPLGVLDLNGRPFGISMVGRKHQEEKLFQIMSAWETLGARRPPPALEEELNQAQLWLTRLKGEEQEAAQERGGTKAKS